MVPEGTLMDLDAQHVTYIICGLHDIESHVIYMYIIADNYIFIRFVGETTNEMKLPCWFNKIFFLDGFCVTTNKKN